VFANEPQCCGEDAFTIPHQAQHPDASEWIRSYWEGQWGSIHVWGKDKRKRSFLHYLNGYLRDKMASLRKRTMLLSVSPSEMNTYGRSCNKGKIFTIKASEGVMSYLLWKWLWLSCRESTAMCARVHLPTMHCHMGVSLLHNPPVLFLQERKGRKDNQREKADSKVQVQL